MPSISVCRSGPLKCTLTEWLNFKPQTTYSHIVSVHAASVNVSVGNDDDDVSSYQVCHVIRGEGAVATNYVTCDARRVGRFVRFQRLTEGSNIDEFTVCEVQVYGYLYHGTVIVMGILIHITYSAYVSEVHICRVNLCRHEYWREHTIVDHILNFNSNSTRQQWPIVLIWINFGRSIDK